MIRSKIVRLIVLLGAVVMTSACAAYRDPVTGVKVGRPLLDEGKLRRAPENILVEKVSTDGTVEKMNCDQLVYSKGYLPPQLRTGDYKGLKQDEVPKIFPKTFQWPLDLSFAKKLRGERSLSLSHNGLDISFAGAVGTVPVLAVDDGEIVLAEFQPTSGFGNLVIVDHGEGWKTLYAHMNSIQGTTISKGGKRVPVKKGQIIGYLGTTGKSTGPHLHFELKYYCENYDPRQILPQKPSAKDLGLQNPDLFLWPN